MLKLTDQRWQAIQSNDVTQDGQFYYGVTSTGIFCRPSCHSRLPKRDHLRLFSTVSAAMQAGFRPCKRCRPTGELVSTDEWVHEINQIIATHYQAPLDLTRLAQLAHGAPYYLHHVYQQVTGQTPMAHLKQVRLAQAKKLLQTTHLSIGDIATACGFQSAAYFSTVFKQAFQQRPSAFR
ncbi:Ada metal-binding domain-containing protein [Lactiplantibacillus sp. WILCCON 0030]|uniref:Ada metal-binding domain-containing protein n=1 Tax=Lactiplantibacillus brownii TaxID=3069269 RepID=A0ABU1AB17_9LACO|nr:Ada metal-binding domain-containing protein [Lactiplantibacillus brownii]MDQ7938154.1 Ada metal-binding domain-containing protein [Lactiplantibacillus brownii]